MTYLVMVMIIMVFLECNLDEFRWRKEVRGDASEVEG